MRLILASAAVLTVRAVLRRDRNSGLLAYGLTVASTFVILSVVTKFTVFGSRYQLAFFALMSALVAGAVDWALPRRGAAFLGVVLLLAARPRLLRLDARPLLADRAGRSVLTSDRLSLYLRPGADEPYREVTRAIEGASCRSVGVMMGGDSP